MVATEERAVATKGPMDNAALLERVVIQGDLSKLQPEHRVAYYKAVCESLGLNPLTRPFLYITLNDKLTLYATRTATDQLRGIKGVSIDRIDHEELDGLYLATVYGHDKTGRTDSEVGAVSIANLKGEARANAIMKALTKAKRRLTLSLAGLGWLDDSEVGSVPAVEPADVDPETGEVHEAQTLQQQVAARRTAVTTSGLATRATSTGPEQGEVGGPSGPPDEPPHPADQVAEPPGSAQATEAPDSASFEGARPGQAGARAVNLDPPPGSTDSGNSTPAMAEGAEAGVITPPSAPEPCEGFGDPQGRCERDMGHKGNHRNKGKESWK